MKRPASPRQSKCLSLRGANEYSIEPAMLPEIPVTISSALDTCCTFGVSRSELREKIVASFVKPYDADSYRDKSNRPKPSDTASDLKYKIQYWNTQLQNARRRVDDTQAAEIQCQDALSKLDS